MCVLLIAEDLRGHEHGTADHSFGIREAGGHAEINHLGPSLFGQVYDVLQFEVAVVDAHRMQGLDSHQQIPPQATSLILTEFVLVMYHIVVEVATTRKVLCDDVVV